VYAEPLPGKERSMAQTEGYHLRVKTKKKHAKGPGDNGSNVSMPGRHRESPAGKTSTSGVVKKRWACRKDHRYRGGPSGEGSENDGRRNDTVNSCHCVHCMSSQDQRGID